MKATISILAAAILIIAGFSIAIYSFGMDNHYTRLFNRVVPILPAAAASGRFVMLSELEERLAMYEHAVNFQSSGALIDYEVSHSNILQGLIEDEIISDLLDKNKLEVDPAELDEYWRHVKSNFTASSTPEELFGVSEDEFKRLVILPDFRRQKLRQYVYGAAADSREYMLASKVKSLVSEDLDFTEAARLYSEDDQSKFIAGDLGLKSADQLGPWLAHAASQIQSTTTVALVVSPQGYHIVRVDGSVRHILIRGFDFAEYLEKARKNYRIYSFIR